MTAQNDNIAKNLIRVVSGFSGGGPVWAFVAAMGGLSADTRLGASEAPDDG